MVKLIFLEKDFSRQVHELTREKTTVGRKKPSHLIIPSESISAQHCEILVWGDDVIVRDLDSANGTFVDEVRLNKQSGVRSGQIVRFGLIKARLEIDPAWPQDDATELTAIHEHGKAVRAIEEEKNNPAATSVFLKTDGAPVSDDQTLLMEEETSRRPLSLPPHPESAKVQAGRPRRGKFLLKAALALLGLGLILWLALAFGS